MLKTQTNYVQFLGTARHETATAAEALKPSLDAVMARLADNAASLEGAMSDCRLLVPVIGAFSAGKSSLLNAFLGAEILPVAISPETALACELHYDTSPRIEAVKPNESVETFPIEGFGELCARAAEFEYLRLYIDNAVLRNIEPLVLVDMPGFDSPLDAHNKAIVSYIDRGSHYVVLISVEEGGLTARTLRQLNEIVGNGRTFSICLSKADLRTPNQSKEVAAHIASQLEAHLGVGHDVVVLDQNSSPGKLTALIGGIDPEQLTRNLFQPHLKNVFFQVDSSLSTVLSTLGKNKQEIQETLRDLQASVTKVEEERRRQLEQLGRNNTATQVQLVLRQVQEELERNTETFVAHAKTGQDAIARAVNDVVREARVAGLRQAETELSEEAVQRFTRAMDGRLRSDFVLSPDMLHSLLDQLKAPLLAAMQHGLNANTKPKSAAGGLASAGMM
jgi:hypothetical protein